LDIHFHDQHSSSDIGRQLLEFTHQRPATPAPWFPKLHEHRHTCLFHDLIEIPISHITHHDFLISQPTDRRCRKHFLIQPLSNQSISSRRQMQSIVRVPSRKLLSLGLYRGGKEVEGCQPFRFGVAYNQLVQLVPPIEMLCKPPTALFTAKIVTHSDR